MQVTASLFQPINLNKSIEVYFTRKSTDLEQEFLIKVPYTVPGRMFLIRFLNYKSYDVMEKGSFHDFRWPNDEDYCLQFFSHMIPHHLTNLAKGHALFH